MIIIGACGVTVVVTAGPVPGTGALSAAWISARAAPTFLLPNARRAAAMCIDIEVSSGWPAMLGSVVRLRIRVCARSSPSWAAPVLPALMSRSAAESRACGELEVPPGSGKRLPIASGRLGALFVA